MSGMQYNAVWAHELYSSFVNAGFEEGQAWELLLMTYETSLQAQLNKRDI